MAKTELKERPQVILPCPRCINGQILAINDWVCFQCGFDLLEKERANDFETKTVNAPSN